MDRLDKLHLGQVVEARIKELGMNVSEFSRRMGMSRSNATGLFTRPDLYVKQLHRIGVVLETDLLGYVAKLSQGVLPDAAELRSAAMADLQRDLVVAEKELAVLAERVENLAKINALQDALLRQQGGGTVTKNSE